MMVMAGCMRQLIKILAFHQWDQIARSRIWIKQPCIGFARQDWQLQDWSDLSRVTRCAHLSGPSADYFDSASRSGAAWGPFAALTTSPGDSESGGLLMTVSDEVRPFSTS